MSTSIRRILVTCVAVATLAGGSACSNTAPVQTTPTPSATVMNGPEVEATPEKYDRTDSTVMTIGASTLYCNPDVGGMELPLNGEANDFIGTVRVRDQGTFTRIEWEKPGASIIIVNDQQWGYINKAKGPAPASTKLVHSTWGGQIKKLKMCSER